MKLPQVLIPVAALLALPVLGPAQEVISYTGGQLTETFDNYGADWTTAPFAWYLGTNVNDVNYKTVSVNDDGTVAIGATILGFNTGNAGSSERSLGMGATSFSRWMEVRVRNDTLLPINYFRLTYDGEIWRKGTTASNTFLTMFFSVDGVNYATMPARFTFTQPITNNPIEPVNGNVAPNRTANIGGFYTNAVLPGQTMYLRWRDFNDSGSDPILAVDNVVFEADTTFIPVTIGISSPTNIQTVSRSAILPVTTTNTGVITYTEFYLDGNLLSSDATAPYTASVDTLNLALGLHSLQAVAVDAFGTPAISDFVYFDLIENTGPSIQITNPPTGLRVLVGTAVTNAVLVNDDVGVVRVEWYLDNVNVLSRTNSPWGYVYNDSKVGTHSLYAVAYDRVGLLATSPTISVVVTNPASYFTLLAQNGATWDYWADAGTNGPPVDPNNSALWYQPAYGQFGLPSGWLSGVGELGAGDANPGSTSFTDTYPETTVIDIGPSTNRYRTIYFRRSFVSGDPSPFINLVLRVLRDDGALVYLNGIPIYTNNLPLPPTNITYTTLAPVAAADEGTVYQNANILPAGLLVNGANTVAVEVHQNSATSSDLSFDLMLWGEPFHAPSVGIVSPTNGTVLGLAGNVTVNALADNFVTNVVFKVNNVAVGGDDTRDPASFLFSFNVPGLAPGTYALGATAQDSFGQTAEAVPVTVIVPEPPYVRTLINSNSVWKYLDDGSDQGTAWQALNFNDSLWPSGNAKLGYGDADVVTTLARTSVGGTTNVTFYFRQKFWVEDLSLYTNLVVRFRRDDGGVVYINAAEVFRSNMPTGPIDYLTFASGNTASETTFYANDVSPGVLVLGDNIIAVEVHQQSLTSTDVGYDLQLQGISSPARVLKISTDGVNVTVTWQGGARLQYKDDLNAPFWNTLFGQTSPYVFSVSSVPGNRFFRLVP